jgi:pimeloyl-ACP methyl ester carboxylesterase
MTAETLVLLHGALFSPDQLADLRYALSDRFRCLTPCLPGHGDRTIPEGGHSMTHFRDAVTGAMDQAGVESAYFFGYSLGGYIALDLALHVPERVKGIITLGTKLDWTTETAAREASFLDPVKLEEKVPAFAQQLAAMHSAQHWTEVTLAVRTFMLELGQSSALTQEKLQAIQMPVLLLNGALDRTAAPEVSESWAAASPHITHEVIADVPHPFDKCPLEFLASRTAQFFNVA